MERSLRDVLPVLGVENDCILSRRGDYTLAYEVSKPAVFSLSGDDHVALHQGFVRALKLLPPHCVFYMQDWFVSADWKAVSESKDDSFLGQASDRFFQGRPYLDHSCYVFLTKIAGGGKVATSASSGLLRRSVVPADSLDAASIQDFMEACGQFVRILGDCGLLRLRRLGAEEIWSSAKKSGVLERYCFLSDGDLPVVKDVSFSDEIQIGDLSCQLFSLGNVEDLPALCGPRMDYDRYSTDKSRFSVGFASAVGPRLLCNHLYSQYIFTGDGAATIRKLEAKRLRLQSLSQYSRENAAARDAVNDFLNEAIGDQQLPVKAHFNVLAWTDRPEEMKDIKNRVCSALAEMGVTPRLESVGAAQIWYAGIPGNAGDLPMNDCFDSFPDPACCFLNGEGCYHDSASPFGLRLVDRLYGRPLHVDISDAPMQGIITNRNKAVFGGSG